MKSKLLQISSDELELVIQKTADKLNMSKAIVEKDLWFFYDFKVFVLGF